MEELNGDIVIEFTARKQAEAAKLQGANYAGQILTLLWKENPAPPAADKRAGGEKEGEGDHDGGQDDDRNEAAEDNE